MEEEVEREISQDEGEHYLVIDEEVELKTHQFINKELSGHLVELAEGYAKVEFKTIKEMTVDRMGLVHSGFISNVANFTAVAAVNEPNVVLISSECRFLSPVKVNCLLVFEGKEIHQEARKRRVHVVGKFNEIKVFEGKFVVVVLDRHVLKLKLVDEEDEVK